MWPQVSTALELARRAVVNLHGRQVVPALARISFSSPCVPRPAACFLNPCPAACVLTPVVRTQVEVTQRDLEGLASQQAEALAKSLQEEVQQEKKKRQPGGFWPFNKPKPEERQLVGGLGPASWWACRGRGG